MARSVKEIIPELAGESVFGISIFIRFYYKSHFDVSRLVTKTVTCQNVTLNWLNYENQPENFALSANTKSCGKKAANLNQC